MPLRLSGVFCSSAGGTLFSLFKKNFVVRLQLIFIVSALTVLFRHDLLKIWPDLSHFVDGC